ncbi:hypothetical protein PIB30_053401, partial [Stylosanthes scabra]|nr:hypothetical protein [Stylosanthes scabra]
IVVRRWWSKLGFRCLWKLVVATRRPLQLAASIADGIMDGGVAMNSGGVLGFVCCVICSLAYTVRIDWEL